MRRVAESVGLEKGMNPALQSPEGDWADCDVNVSTTPWEEIKQRVAIPRRGLG